MSERLIPQYAKTSDPDVIAIARRNEDGKRAWHEQARAFAERHGRGPEAGQFMYGGWFGGRHVSAIVSDGEPESGRWKQGRRSGTWEPFKNNPLRKEFAALSFRAETIPGLDEGGYATGYRDGATITHAPSVFVHDGVAYMGLGAQPLRDQSAGWGTGEFSFDIWTEILASEWHLAREAYEAVTR